MMRVLVLVFLTSLIASAGPVPATQPTTRRAIPIPKDETPRQMLLRATKVFDSEGVDARMEFFDFSGEKERTWVRTQCEHSIALTSLAKSARQKLGKEAADAVIRAASNCTDEELVDAEIQVNGDHAVLKFDLGPEVPLVRKNGTWRFATHETMSNMSDESMDATTCILAYSRDELPKVQKDFESGKLPTVAALCDAVNKVVRDSVDHYHK